MQAASVDSTILGVKCGWWGHGHIVPRLIVRGVSEDEIVAIDMGNPTAILALV